MNRTYVASLAAVLLTASFVTTGSQTAGRGLIQGIIVRSTTGEPVVDALIILGRLSPNDFRAETMTDAEGRFRFENLEAGEYRLLMRKNGYAEQFFPARDTMTKLAAGQSLDNLALRLIPTGTVTGRLLDRQGQPLGGVPVRLRNETNGREVTTRTNDRGEYRFFFVTPGSYALTAGIGADGVQVASNGAARRYNEEFDNVYYPGVLDPAQAEPIDVKAGEEFSSRDMVMGEPRTPAPRTPTNTRPDRL